MNLYRLSRKERIGYDTFDSAVVAAESEQDARTIHPSQYVTHHKNGKWMGTFLGGNEKGKEYVSNTNMWVQFEDIDSLTVKYLGETALERGVVCASFNAG